MPSNRIIAAALAGACAAALAVPAAGQGQRTITPQNTVTVTVGRWDPVTEQYTSWPDLGGDYEVEADGTLVLPMAGTIAAQGLSASDLGAEIAERLGNRMGIGDEVTASVSISGLEPVYVVGGVQSSGSYEYSPGLTVLKAISLAGGIRTPGATFLRSERNALGTMGEYRVLELNLLRDLATRARLRAELDDTEEIDFPPEVTEAPLGRELMEQERAIRDARETALESSLRQFDELETLLEERIARIEEQLELRNRQLELARSELDSQSQLVEQGLSVESSRNRLERLVAEQEVRRLELQTARLSAEQQLNELGRDRLDLVNERRRAMVEQIRSVRVEIEKLRVRMETQAALYAEALRYGDGFVEMDRTGGAQLQITRRTSAGVEVIDADEGTELRPGDVLQVALASPGTVSVPRGGPAGADIDPELAPPADLGSLSGD